MTSQFGFVEKGRQSSSSRSCPPVGSMSRRTKSLLLHASMAGGYGMSARCASMLTTSLAYDFVETSGSYGLAKHVGGRLAA